MPFPLQDAALAALILLFAFFIRGIAGFGSGLIAVPLLALFLPLTYVVPAILLLDLVASIRLGGIGRQHVHWGEVRSLLPPTLIGVVLGTTVLVSAPKAPILTLLGGYIILAGLRSLLMHLDHGRHLSHWWAVPTGLVGGTISGLFGTGGPPYVIYITHRLRDKARIRATVSAIFTLEGLTRLVAGLLAGLLSDPLLWWSLAAGLPILYLGLRLGERVHLHLSNEAMERLIGALLVGAGGAVLMKAAAV
ncbi:MAG: sulfite exporter TauE/SafE family protein [Betaproteobacteria bacterium]|nr:sulfite exporter TauE/SafE family protein [Betaproteobacteria bacterium]